MVITMTNTNSPLRPTRQRRTIAAALRQLEDFRSAQDIYDVLLRRGEKVGLSTVYRTLQSMAELGEVDRLISASGEAVYRRCSDEHHHHLLCRDCGATEEITGEEIEAWARGVAADHGFTQVEHNVELFGLCPRCS